MFSKTTPLLSPDRTYVKLMAYIKGGLQAGISLIQSPDRTTLRKAQLVMTVKPWFTMLSAPRLFSLYERAVETGAISGDIVECGVWRGGGLATMGAACADHDITRQFWAFDSFEGLPPPSEQDGSEEHDTFHEGLNLGSPKMVRKIWHRLGLQQDNLAIVPGWFNETLPDAPIEQIAVLHCDGDWYDSVKMVLEALYDRVAVGGAVIVDDYYYWEGTQRALDEFLTTRGVSLDILQHDALPAVYFFKPSE